MRSVESRSFRAGSTQTSVKTSVLFLEKNSTRQNFKALFCQSTRPGKKSNGAIDGADDYDVILKSLQMHFKEQGFAWALQKGLPCHLTGVSNVGLIDDIKAESRLDAEYFIHRQQPAGESLTCPFVNFSDITAASVKSFKPNLGAEDIEYIDISCIDRDTGTIRARRMKAGSAPSRAAYLVEQGDVLVSTVRPDRNVVGFVASESSVPVVASSGLCVLRAHQIEPEVVFALCKTESFRRAVTQKATASMYPVIKNADIFGTTLVLPSRKKRAEITLSVRLSFDLLLSAKKHMGKAFCLAQSGMGIDTLRAKS